MNMNDINITQSLQNAIRPAEKSDIPVQSRSNISPAASSAQFAAQSQPAEMPAKGLIVSIDVIKQQLDNILVNYPPFFPLGTFQRLDLIKKIRSIEDQIPKSSIPENLKQSFTREKLSVDATDEEISATLGSLFTLKDTLAKDSSVAGEQVQPGVILDIKV